MTLTRIQTVLGPVEPGELGFTLPHEHIICDASLWGGAVPPIVFYGLGHDVGKPPMECVGLARGANPNDVDFFLTGPEKTWAEMFSNILENDGADAAHSLETLLWADGGLVLDDEDEMAREAFEAHADWLQAFFDLAKNLTVEFA